MCKSGDRVVHIALAESLSVLLLQFERPATADCCWQQDWVCQEENMFLMHTIFLPETVSACKLKWRLCAGSLPES